MKLNKNAYKKNYIFILIDFYIRLYIGLLLMFEEKTNVRN